MSSTILHDTRTEAERAYDAQRLSRTPIAPAQQVEPPAAEITTARHICDDDMDPRNGQAIGTSFFLGLIEAYFPDAAGGTNVPELLSDADVTPLADVARLLADPRVRARLASPAPAEITISHLYRDPGQPGDLTATPGGALACTTYGTGSDGERVELAFSDEGGPCVYFGREDGVPLELVERQIASLHLLLADPRVIAARAGA